MLVSVTVENWMSFRQPATLSMIATRERQHSSRIPRVDRYNLRILPIATIYGGNASGKTNLCKAVNFAKLLIVRGTQPGAPIPVDPFRLDAKAVKSPSRFAFEILVDETVFRFSFAVTRKAVVEESLVRIAPSSEQVLYLRKEGKIHFHPSLKKKDFLQFAFQGTRDNQLFLTNSVSQKVDEFKGIYDWFDSLEFVAPDTRFELFGLFLDEADPKYGMMNEVLQRLDTGITRLGSQEIPIDSFRIPEPVKAKMQADLKDGTSLILSSSDPNEEQVVLSLDNGRMVAKRLITYHTASDQSDVRFDLRRESDGTRRVISLLPAFLDLSENKSNSVYIIDEIDRSLHTLLTRQLIEMFLSRCSAESRAQLVMTTHDVLLMDQELLRRDEMWVTERNNGASDLYSFSEFKDVRYDKDVRKSYLQGRLGGIPRILLEGIRC